MRGKERLKISREETAFCEAKHNIEFLQTTSGLILVVNGSLFGPHGEIKYHRIKAVINPCINLSKFQCIDCPLVQGCKLEITSSENKGWLKLEKQEASQSDKARTQGISLLQKIAPGL